MEGTDAKAILDVPNKTAREPAAEDDVEKLIAFASTILASLTDPERRFFNEE